MTSRFRWGFASTAERRAADLFYADLMGLPEPQPRAPRAPQAREDQPDPSFLRWAPNWRGSFPPRPSGALGGRAFMRTLAGESSPSNWAAREDAMVAELARGNMPDALLRWVKIDLSVTRNNRTITGSVEVLPDYLSIGHNGDWMYAPLDPVSAQKVADRLDVNLPTARICHAIYLKALPANRIGMIARDYYHPHRQRRTAARGRAQDSTASYVEHTEAIQARMGTSITLGTLVAGHKKDVVVAKRLLTDSNKIAFHGFYDGAGYPMEPCYENARHLPDPSCQKDAPTLAHSRRFSDYSQGVRLVRDLMIVDGQQRSMREVLRDAELSWLLSSEGPIDPPRIPNVPIVHTIGPFEEVPLPPPPLNLPLTLPSAVSIDPASAPGLGTSRTTSPVAVTSPHRQMNELLDRELILFSKARILALWVDRRFSTTFDEAFRDSALVASLDLRSDRALMSRLRPFPQSAIPSRRGQLFTTDARLAELLAPPADAYALWPIFDVLHHYGVVLLPPNAQNPFGNPSVLASITRVEARLSRERFDAQSAAIEAFARTFKLNVAAGGEARVVDTGTLAAPAAAADASRPAMERTFARAVLALVGRVRATFTDWTAGTYRRHWWNEFSIDAFIRTGRDSRGFYTRSAVRNFFSALNAACEQDAAPGKFAWKAIYNDEELAREMNGVYGDGRVLFGVPGHGPGPDMHVHLDVRPLTVPLDTTTGFRLEGGRVVLVTP